MTKEIKSYKKNIFIISIIFLISFIMYIPFLKMHMAPDTYQIIDLGYSNYATIFFMKSARIVTAITFYLADVININYETFVISMGIVALISQTLSVFFIYKLLIEELKQNTLINRIILLILSYCLVFNMFSLEFLLYAESGIICFSILLCVWAVKEFNKKQKNKYLKAFLIVVIATFFYQGTINFFFTLNFFVALIKKKDNKTIAKETLISFAILAISFIINAISIFICTNCIGMKQERFTSNINIISNFNVIINATLYILYTGFDFLPYSIIILMIIIISIYLLLKKGVDESFFMYVFLVILSIFVCVAPLITMKSQTISARMCMSIGSLIPMSIIYIIFACDSIKNKEKKVILILSLMILVYTAITYIKMENMNLKANKIDNLVGEKINYQVKNYEQKTGNIIKKVAVTNDLNRTFYLPNSQKNTYTERSLGNYYCILEILEYYTNKKLEYIKMDETIYKEHFENKDWDTFSKEQFVFVDDTMYMCIY